MRTPAILGGEPAFKQPLHVGRPNLPNRKLFNKYVNQIFDSRWLTNNGPLVMEFKERLEAFLHVKHCIPVCNGTIALELAERALGFASEVILPSYTFVATAHSLQWQKIIPVFADIKKRSVTICPNSIRSAITSKTSGIIGVHVYGHPCDYMEIKRIALEHNLKTLYDAAHSFGCEIDGQSVACFGDASVFSFHATKFFNSFEGGAITTNDDCLAEKILHMTNFGFSGSDRVDYLGINGKMSEISAAMGLAMFESLETIRECNRENFYTYKNCFDNIDGLSLLLPPEELTNNNWQYVIAQVDEKLLGVSRDYLVTSLEAENILVRKYFYPGCHNMFPYNSEEGKSKLALLNTNTLAESVISFPTGQSISKKTISLITECIYSILYSSI